MDLTRGAARIEWGVHGLKKYTHRDRTRVINEIIPLVKRKFGKNLLALAAQGSYARHEDFGYSDLELIAFVKRMPKGERLSGMGKIRNGLLVELVWTTRNAYLRDVKDVNEFWFISGSDRLLPIINRPFVNRLNRYRQEHLKKHCLMAAASAWNQVQEGTAKLLNAISRRNRSGVPVLFLDMFLHMLEVLSFLNHKPYTTLSRFVAQARRFRIKPRSFEKLCRITTAGTYQDLASLEERVTVVFREFERIFERLHIDPYYDNIDPQKPMNPYAKW